MRVERVVDVAGREVRIKELTLGEIRAWFADASAGGGDVIDALLFDDFDPDALMRMTDLSQAELGEMTPTVLRELADKCREVNADFFAMRQRMVKAQQTLLAGLSNGAP